MNRHHDELEEFLVAALSELRKIDRLPLDRVAFEAIHRAEQYIAGAGCCVIPWQEEKAA